MTSQGVLQAIEVGKFFVGQEVDLVLSSTKSRALETYQRASFGLTGVPFETDDRLVEMKWDATGGRRRKEDFTPDVEERAISEGHDFRLNPGGDTNREKFIECMEVLKEKVALVDKSPEGRNLRVVMISHSATIKAIVGVACGIPRHVMVHDRQYKIGNGAVWELRPGDTSPRQHLYPGVITPATARVRQFAYGLDRNNGRSRATAYA